MTFNNKDTQKLEGVIQFLLDSSNRINQASPQSYWYPLSAATYGVDEILEAIDSLCTFRTTMWEKTLEFESLFSNYQDCPNSVMVNSGSSADLLLCFLLSNPLNPLVEPGAEILISAVTWPTQIWSAMMAGYKVRLVDVDPKTLNVDLDDLERNITPQTRVIFVVHVMGIPCDMDRICDLSNKYNLIIIEDCCEALGAEWSGIKVGNFGIAASYSFFFSHHMTTMEGGMIACSSNQIADHLKILRAHGWVRNVDQTNYGLANYDVDPRYAFINWGFNLRPTELQAAFGLHQIKKLPDFNMHRLDLANQFFEFIDLQVFFSRPSISPKASPTWFALPLMVALDAPFNRHAIVSYLELNGVETRPIIAGNIAKHPVSKVFPFLAASSYPGADLVHSQGFYLGLSAYHSREDIDKLIHCFKEFLSQF